MLRRIILCLLLIALLPLGHAADAEDWDLRVVFFDCGKADSALVQVGESTMLIDTGMDKDGKAILSKLRTLGVESLDYLVITHPHKDHIGGADRILKDVDVGQVLDGPLEVENKQVKQYRAAMEKLGMTPLRLHPGDTFPLGGALVTCLGPLRETAQDENDLSLVLRIDYQDTSFLFTGDAERDALTDLMVSYAREGLLDADVLKVPHHGRSERNSEDFFSVVKPQIAFIPCAQGTEDDLPDSAVVYALRSISTDIYIADEGDVAVYSDGSQVWAEQGSLSAAP